MNKENNHTSDREIISMLNAGNPECWEHLYNKYSSLMYGICIKITGSETMAAEIFEQAFMEIKTKSTLACLHTSVAVCLTKHTIAAVIAYYKTNHLTHILYDAFNKDYPLLLQLYVKGNNLSHAASMLEIDMEKAKKQLHSEMEKLFKNFVSAYNV